MRPLTEDETKLVFEKLFKYVGSSIKELIDRPDEPYCMRLQKDRVYYVSETIMLKATNIGRDNLISLGTCIGKFTKSGKFNLTITALEVLGQFAKHKIWVKQTGEMSFLYGNHVLKAHLARISEDCEQYSGVVIYNMSDVPLGFGVSARSTAECRKLDPTAIVAFRQGDVGEYLRSEDSLFAPEK